MNNNLRLGMGCLLATLATGIPCGRAATKTQPEIVLTKDGDRLLGNYSAMLKDLQTEIRKTLPDVPEPHRISLQQSREATRAAELIADAAQQSLGKIQTARALVDHAKGKWIGGAEKGIAEANAALGKATTDAGREAAKKDLLKWQANKEDGIQELGKREEALNKAKTEEPQLAQANQEAQQALAAARTHEKSAAEVLLHALDPTLSSDKLDAKLVMSAVIAGAKPRGLAGFAQQGREQEAMVDQLLADPALMMQMLEAGGAKYGNYGKAMEIYMNIQKAGSKAREGTLKRLAIAVCLEHAMPIGESGPKDPIHAPATVDPVKRYLHYEKAFLDGELDPAFRNLGAWEQRMVVDSDAPDSILAWGREMLRNYRPDHIDNPDYGWRYSSTVRTEVPYGSQNVKDDNPSLHNYQNIIKDGGVCGRRAFFGRFILKSFGIPTWGVTQKAHAALSHWTPKGWVVNLGAGFEHSWWDKDEAPRSGADFLLETQARVHGRDFLKVLRARWISCILGEEPYNDRKGVAGGFWSSMAHYQTVALAATATGLGPLGQDLAETNESMESQKMERTKPSEADQAVVTGPDGVITIPAVACSRPTGSFASMKSYSGGLQLHCSGGFKAEYAVELPNAGKYAVVARVVTAQEGQKLLLAANDAKAPVGIAVPYTIGMWRQTQPVEVSLTTGKNILHIKLEDASRGVTIKEFTLTPVK